MSLRRFRALLDGLPPHARSPGQEWSATDYLLAVIADQLAELTYVTVKAAGGKASRPKPLPRPAPAGGRQEHRGGEGGSRSGDLPGPGRPTTGKMGSWFDAAEALASMAGVRVTRQD
jgi:hypothetical protein